MHRDVSRRLVDAASHNVLAMYGLALCARPGPALDGTGRAKKAGQHRFGTVSTYLASPTFPP
eukprot:2155077-Pyramimonas_sp.AAC.1